MDDIDLARDRRTTRDRRAHTRDAETAALVAALDNGAVEVLFQPQFSAVRGTLIGAVGLWYPVDFPEREIKWAIHPAWWGRGYASEAARAVQQMAQTAYPERPPISFIDRDNAASIRVALAVGASFERETDFRGRRFQVFRHAFPAEGRPTA